MANSTATFSINLSYVGAGGNTVTESAQSILALYNGYNCGKLDCPSGSVTGTEFAIPTGSLAEATAVLIKSNVSSCAIDVRCNGATGGEAGFALGPSGAVFIGHGMTGQSGLLTGVSCFLAKSITGPMTISYWVFGDPT